MTGADISNDDVVMTAIDRVGEARVAQLRRGVDQAERPLYVPRAFPGGPPLEERYLFHYTRADTFLRIVDGGSMHGSHFAFMDDRSELSHGLEIALPLLENAEAAESDATTRGLLSQTIAWIRGGGFTGQVRAFAISFTENGNQLSQWREYCRGGGYALAIPLDWIASTNEAVQVPGEREPRGNANAAWRFGPCIYDDAVKAAILRERIDEIVQLTREHPQWGAGLGGQLMRVQAKFVVDAIFFKDEAFREEGEWRLASLDAGLYRPGVQIGPVATSFRGGSDSIVQYRPLFLREPSISSENGPRYGVAPLRTVGAIVGPMEKSRAAASGAAVAELFAQRFRGMHFFVDRSNIPNFPRH